ncbi:MAG: cob(I)yrinic acid a,c-diamide adenosyltransferase [Deltaproteobacteria bacterium]|nr:cob(I)yrinic acid a,c-diamide adenosyltransferase [Deltaproteobacteria bacterium]
MEGKTLKDAFEGKEFGKGPLPRESKGLLHIYTGDGKGKTTCAIGLAIRAAGWGFKVLFVQFFKPERDPSGEKEVFRKTFPAIELVRGNARHPFFTGHDADLPAVKTAVTDTFEFVKLRSREGFDLVVLDEAIGAITGGFLKLEDIMDFLDGRPENLEVVFTGRDAPGELVKRADYVTEMLKIKHPYDNGIKARRGIDF